MVEANQVVNEKVETSFKHLNAKTKLTHTNATVADKIDNDGIDCHGNLGAVQWTGTGTVAVFNCENPIQFTPALGLIKGHSGHIQDIAWSPFDNHLLATCADDGKAKFWMFEGDEGTTQKLNTHITEADLEIEAHARKCLGVKWHRAAENLIATHSIDKTIKLFDVDSPDEPAACFTDLKDFCTQIEWSPDGKMIGGVTKGKSFIAADPRTESLAYSFAIHKGPKQQRCSWVDDYTVVTSGFDSEAQRQFGVWDIRNPEQALAMGPLIEGTGIPYMWFDREY